MDPKSSAGPMSLAPVGAGVGVEGRSYAQTERRSAPLFPPLDDHLAVPETTYDEVIRGRRVSTMTALPPHADAQARLAFLIAPHVKSGFVVSTELLTRVSQGSDFATDVCIRKAGTDPQTGTRYLEEISFEVVNEQSMRDVTDKVEDLIFRGVRRVFALFVKTGEVHECTRKTSTLVLMDPKGMIEDRVFVRAIPVRALMDHALSENEVARALIAKGNEAIVELKRDAEQSGHKKGLDEGHKKGLDEGHKKGLDEGRRSMLIELLTERFGELPAAVEARVRAAESEQLRAWSKKVLFAESLEDVFC